ncbi:MAG TPA: hypothetical protein VLB44_10325 [Kofleriaceae bacterium]|nr:hypothetical protein [Kofleriaceae bacterium]
MTPWLRVWTRAVVGPAWRRAMALWVGSAIVGAVVFGPTGMQPRDLTGLALHVPGVAAVLGLTWLLLFVPTARLLVRAEAAAFLRSLPGPRTAPRVITVLALVGLQLPWLVLWLLGEHALGLAIVAGWTLVIGLVAVMRLRPVAHRAPVWSSSLTALVGIYRRALGRRASDALVRGAGLAVLAGLVGGLMIRNNAATGGHAAVLATAGIAIVLVPGWAGVLLPLVEAQRSTTWPALSLGISAARRSLALAVVIAAVYVASAVIAIAAAAITASCDIATLAELVAVSLATVVAAALVATRAVIHADRQAADAPRDITARSPAAARVVVGAVTGSALGVIAIAWLGPVGAIGAVALGTAAVASARPA